MFHSEGIRWAGSALYNAVSGSGLGGDKMMRRYALLLLVRLTATIVLMAG
jgi:hypothetical protein